MAGLIDQIKDRVDIVDLISSYLKLQKSGINYKARCPFHNEKSGSFFVSPERQIWHCFGCSLGGDIFGFIKQIEGVEFPESLRILAIRAGVELYRDQKLSNEFKETQSEKTKLLDICDLAAKFFEKQLWQSTSGNKALEYLRERGTIDGTIRKFRLGWSPDSWTVLYDFLSRHYDDKSIFDAGLIIKKDRGGYYDRFRSRIIFPIFDINSQIVGFSGRILQVGSPDKKIQKSEESEPAKYINSPQTPIYDKSRVLYGLNEAKLDIRRNNRCLVVEGNMDVIMSHQVGATNVVASSGTALTDGQLRIIKRYSDNLDLCFDADAAGSIATDRGVSLALTSGFNVGIVTLSGNISDDGHVDELVLKDPADYVRIHGVKWAEVSQKSQPFLEFYFQTTQKLLDVSTALGKKLMAQKLVPFLAVMANKIEQAHWVNELSVILKTKEDLIYEEINKVKQTEFPDAQTDTSPEQKHPIPLLGSQEEALLSLIIKKPELVKIITPESKSFLSVYFQDLLKKQPWQNDEKIIPENKTSNAGLDNQETESALVVDFAFLKSQELWSDLKDRELEEEFIKIFNQIKRRQVNARLADLEYEIKNAERSKEKEKLTSLVSEFSKVSKQIS